MWEWWEMESRPFPSRVPDANANWYNFGHRCIVTTQMIDNRGVSLIKVKCWSHSLCTKSESFLEVHAQIWSYEIWLQSYHERISAVCAACIAHATFKQISLSALLEIIVFCVQIGLSIMQIVACYVFGYTFDWDGHGRLVGSPFPVDHTSAHNNERFFKYT